VDLLDILKVPKGSGSENMSTMIYKFRVKEFGPLIVAMDSHGNHLYFEVKNKAKEKLPEIYRQIGVG
jgi:L(+)-tartrate dehydratase beta subunit